MEDDDADDDDDGTGTGDDEKNGMIVIAVFFSDFLLVLEYYCATDTARQIIRAENGFHFQTSKSDVLLL
jgi:hypothetical protein